MTDMRLIGDTFPLLVYVAPKRYDAASVQDMAEAFEPYYRRGERYSLLTLQLPGSVPPGAVERKLILEWVNSPYVREHTSRLCVGGASVVDGTLIRGVATALLWFWKPPFPFQLVSTPLEGLEVCTQHLIRCGVALPRGANGLRSEVIQVLETLLR
ncbi:MAG: hypothetical protein QM756_09855 [Polyangiaceae bacterium]